MLIEQLGEKRKIYINVSSKKNERFNIDAAKLELQHLTNNVLETESECECTIDGTEVSCIVEPKQKGVYVLKLYLGIANETIIKKFNMSVDG